MPTFPTPQPVALRIRNGAGRISVAVADTTETTVDLEALNDAGARAIESTIVEHHGQTVTVEIPTKGGLLGRSPAVAISVCAPLGSTLSAVGGSADIDVGDGFAGVDTTAGSGTISIGRVEGDVHARSGSGTVSLAGGTGAINIGTGSGDITITDAGADTSVATGSGDIRITTIAGTAATKTGSGDVVVGELDGQLETKSGSGDTSVERARAGAIHVRSASGDVRVGVAEGTAAWLDVSSVSGHVDQALPESTGPSADQARLTVGVSTVSGDIEIRRAG